MGILLLATAVLWTVSTFNDDPPVLRPGDSIQGELSTADADAHTSTLDKDNPNGPTRAKSYRIEPDGSGPYLGTLPFEAISNRERYGHAIPSTWGTFVLDGAPK